MKNQTKIPNTYTMQFENFIQEHRAFLVEVRNRLEKEEKILPKEMKKK